jgi:glycerol-3-phosphate dehydrogenase (NAD(P)+)
MGAGMWGTTFAQVLCDAGTPTVLWGRRPELTEAVMVLASRSAKPERYGL